MEAFIARRLYKSEQGRRSVSRPAVLIAQIGVALGLAVMLITIAVSFGFKHEVREKAVGFSAHIHITSAGISPGNGHRCFGTLYQRQPYRKFPTDECELQYYSSAGKADQKESREKSCPCAAVTADH